MSTLSCTNTHFISLLPALAVFFEPRERRQRRHVLLCVFLFLLYHGCGKRRWLPIMGRHARLASDDAADNATRKDVGASESLDRSVNAFTLVVVAFSGLSGFLFGYDLCIVTGELRVRYGSLMCLADVWLAQSPFAS